MLTQGLLRLQKYFLIELKDEVLEIYIEELSRYNPEQLQIIFSRVIRKCKFFPRIAEIEELAGNAGSKQIAQQTSRAHEAFEEACSMMRKIGSYRTPDFIDPLIPAVIKNRFNGWIKFGQTEVNDWMRKAFVEEYRALSEVEELPSIELEGMHQRKQLCGGIKQIAGLI